MKKLFISAIATLALSQNVFAGQIDGGYVSHIATVNGVILFKVAGGTPSGRPACATSQRFAAPVDSEHYQAIITAFQLGSQVTLGNVVGFGTCTRWANSEDLRWIEINR